MIIAVNMGTNGEPGKVKRELDRLVKPATDKQLNVNDMLKMAEMKKKTTR